MIMSDQDGDGSHIKGLIINFIQFFWPSLFKISGYLKQFITPLLKVSKNR
jgi:DNA topoisomerase-2